MEDFVEEIQQQDSQVEQQAAEVQETTEAVPAVEETAENEVVSEETIEALEEKRDIVNEDAERHRKLRDELNNQVRETKELRDEWNQKVTALKEQLAPYRNEKSDEKNEVPVKQLKKQLQDLEYTQMTKPLGKDKENEIIKQISVLAKQIEEREKIYEQNDEVKNLVQQLRDAKAEAEVYHHQVSEYAEKAQAAHDKMIGFYEQADRLRKEADAAQAKFVECKQAARIQLPQQEELGPQEEVGQRGQEGGQGDLRALQGRRQALHRGPHGPPEVRVPLKLIGGLGDQPSS